VDGRAEIYYAGVAERGETVLFYLVGEEVLLGDGTFFEYHVDLKEGQLLAMCYNALLDLAEEGLPVGAGAPLGMRASEEGRIDEIVYLLLHETLERLSRRFQ
jgi:hypothetical protein